MHLVLEGYLKEDFHFTPYSTITYLVAGPRGMDPDMDIGTILVPSLPSGRTKKTKRKTIDSADSQGMKRRAFGGGGSPLDAICVSD